MRRSCLFQPSIFIRKPVKLISSWLLFVVLTGIIAIGLPVEYVEADTSLEVINNSKRSLKQTPVTIPLQKISPSLPDEPLSALTPSGTVLPSQLDDLNGDGSVETLTVRMHLPPESTRTIVLRSRASDTTKPDALSARLTDEGCVLENRALRISLPQGRIVHQASGAELLHKYGGFKSPGDWTLVNQGPVRAVAQTSFKKSNFRIRKTCWVNRNDTALHMRTTWTNRSDSEQSLQGIPVGWSRPGLLGRALSGKRPGRVNRLLEEYMPSNIRQHLFRHPKTGWAAGIFQHTVDGFLRVVHYTRDRYKFKFVNFGRFGNPDFKKHPEGGPIAIEPGASFTFPMTVRFYRGNKSQVVNSHRSALVSDRSPVTVLGPSGSALKVGQSSAYLEESFQDPHRWRTEKGAQLSINDGTALLRSKSGNAGAYTYLTRDLRDPTELRGRVKLPEKRALRIRLDNLKTGNRQTFTVSSSPFSIRVDKRINHPTRGPFRLSIIPVNGAVALQHLSFSWPEPSRPELSFPVERGTLHPPGVSFSFHSTTVQRCEQGYRVEVATDPNFDAIYARHDRPNEIGYFGHASPKMTIVPNQLYDPGTYYWRVRARSVTGTPGPWTEARSFRVTKSNGSGADPHREVTHKQPLFLFTGRLIGKKEQVYRPMYHDFPPEIRNVVVFEVPTSSWKNRSDVEEWMGDDSFPILLRFHKKADLALIEWMFRTYPRVLGFYFGEKGFDKDGRSLKRGMKLARAYGKYGGVLGGWKHMRASRVLGKKMRTLGKNFVAINKSNNVGEPLARYVTSAGLRLSGRIDFWGTETEWGPAFKPYGLGMDRSAKREIKKKGGTRPVDWMQPFVYGLSLGAPAFRVERGMWTGHVLQGWRDGEFKPFWTHALGPFYRDILKYDLIPSRSDMRSVSRVAFRSHPSYALYRPQEWKNTFVPNRRIGVAYGVTEDDQEQQNPFRFEWIPNTSRYFLVPILPMHATKEEKSFADSVVRPESFNTPADVRSFLNKQYPPTKSEAYAVRAGDTAVVMNTNDRMDPPMSRKATPESFHLNMTRGPVASVTGTVTYNEYLIGKQWDDRLMLHCNDYRDRNSRVQLHVNKPVNVRVKPAEAVQNQQWSSNRSTLDLTLDHSTGVVRVFVNQK